MLLLPTLFCCRLEVCNKVLKVPWSATNLVVYVAACSSADESYCAVGSGAFKVFQPAVMDKVLSCFKLVRLLESKHQSSGAGAGGGSSKRKATAGKAATGHAKKKRGVQRRAMDVLDNDDNEDPLVNIDSCFVTDSSGSL